MRRGTANYFLGSLFSRQAIYAYSAAGTFTTAFQLLLLFGGTFSDMPQRTEKLPLVMELYIETLFPLWIPPITRWNFVILVMNCYLALMLLLLWTVRFDSAV